MSTEEKSIARQDDYLKMMPLDAAKDNYVAFHQFVSGILKKDLDYGVIPGTPKPTLYKPGAEKLRFVYSLGVEFECIENTSTPDLVDYTYRCIIKSQRGQILAQCEGNCNSYEAKFGWLWKSDSDLPAGFDKSGLQSRVSGKRLEEFEFAIEKAETGGQYGKPKEYWDNWKKAIDENRAKPFRKKAKSGKDFDAWYIDDQVTQYRVKNPDVLGLKNTIMKMAQKRAFVGAILIATGASEYFTQDIEDMDLDGRGHIYSDTHTVPDDIPPVQTMGVQDIPFEEVQDNGDAGFVDRTPSIPGHWYAKLEKCKTPEDVDALALANKETVMAHPELRKEFNARKAILKKQQPAQSAE